MASRASITFTQVGIQPPVYVVTSLSSPPWEPLEMSVSDEKTASGDLIFTRQFDHVADGSYQYKVRIGEGHWVVDESKEAAVDDSGNRNNVLKVEPDVESSSTYSSVDVSTKEQLHDSVQPHDTVQSSEPKASLPDQAEKEKSSPPVGDVNESVGDSDAADQVPNIPTPFVVVEKIPDKDQPEYGNAEHKTLPEDASKRAADAEPDFETIKAESPEEDKQKQPEVPLVPSVVVEKTDDAPSHGDDFGEEATSAQKLAHELRAADASPDKVVVSPEVEPADPPIDEESTQANASDAGELDAAPLFRHESFESSGSENVVAEQNPAMDAIEEESSKSSTDQTGSEAGLDTPSELSEIREEENDAGTSTKDHSPGDPGNGPLLSHETEVSADNKSIGELDNGPLLSHETDTTADKSIGELDNRLPPSQKTDISPDESVGELDNGPLLSHETGSSAEDESLGELDNGPLLSHETGSSAEDESPGELADEPLLSHDTGLSSYEASVDDVADGIVEGDSDVVDRDEDDEAGTLGSEHAPTFQHETFADDEYGSEAPLLPHERSSIASSVDDSEIDPAMEDGEQVFPYETETANTILGQARGSQFFINRTNSGSLPHRIPASDEEDDNLQDPLLERFPTGRDQILERVATIGSQLPVDETLEPLHDPHSPELSVLSQACSSVDLAPSTSPSLLKAVAEEESLESDSTPDPPSLALDTSEQGPASAEKTVRIADSKTEQSPETTNGSGIEDSSSRSAQSSETESVQKNDGANESSKDWGKVYDSIATPAKALDLLTPPLTPERKAVKEKEASSATGARKEHSRLHTSDSIKTTPALPQSYETGEEQKSLLTDQDNRTSTPANFQNAETRKQNWLQGFVRTVFGSIGRFLTACVGGRKQASGTVLVVGLAVAAYYYLFVFAS